MSLDASNIHVAATGAIWYAPAGATMPTDSTSALTGFTNLGFLSDGFEVANDLKTKEVTVWQTAEVVKLINQSMSRKINFEAVETNTNTLALAWGGATVTPGAGDAYSITIPDAQKTVEFSLILDLTDGDTNARFVFSRVALSSLPKVKYGRQDEIKYGFEIQALKPIDNSDIVKIYGVNKAI